jgi:hypothetical protein
MIPKRLRLQSEGKINLPLDLTLLFKKYDESYDGDEISNSWLTMQLRGYLDLRPEASPAVRKLVSERLRKIELNIDAKRHCKKRHADGRS